VTDAEHELAGQRFDHPLVHTNTEGELARLNVHYALTADSVPKRTCLRVNYAHAVELFFIHSEILTRTTDTRLASMPASRTATGRTWALSRECPKEHFSTKQGCPQGNGKSDRSVAQPSNGGAHRCRLT